jgi:hypothetical protein
MILRQKILTYFELWQPDLLVLPQEIIALNIGIQNLDNGTFEIYLDGYDWYEMTNDVWLLDTTWGPRRNYLIIKKAEYPIQTPEMMSEVKVSFDIVSHSGSFKVPKHVELITLTAGGQPETLFYRQPK